MLDAQTVPFVDITAAQMLIDLTQDLARESVDLLVARDIGQVRDLLQSAGAEGTLTDVHQTVELAVDAARDRGNHSA
ncbi:STAS domain-containing protein [Kribbella sp. NBC_00359]